jgi:hypothetical protein
MREGEEGGVYHEEKGKITYRGGASSLMGAQGSLENLRVGRSALPVSGVGEIAPRITSSACSCPPIDARYGMLRCCNWQRPRSPLQNGESSLERMTWHHDERRKKARSHDTEGNRSRGTIGGLMISVFHTILVAQTICGTEFRLFFLKFILKRICGHQIKLEGYI